MLKCDCKLQVDVDESERPKSDAGGTEGLAGALARALAGRAQKLNTGLCGINFLQIFLADLNGV